MSSRITFNIIESESSFLHPRKGFAPFSERFQVRIDPLTGRTGHFSHFGAVKQQKLPFEDYQKPEIKGFCPFCIENREKTTPKFLYEILPEGRKQRNESVLIPNLFPYDVYSGVIIMTDDHVVPLDGLNEKRLNDAFSLGIEFLKLIKGMDQRHPYHVMSWNYMPPSGGGLVHPHQQYFASEYPGNQFMDEINASERYFKRNGSNYWSDLIIKEKEEDCRYIGQVGSSHWIASFVSLGIMGEIMCIFPDVFTIDAFTDEHIEQLISGLTKVFKYYMSTGVFSFNASLFFGPEDQGYFSSHFRIIPRTFLNTRDFAPDINFFQALLSESISVMLPERLCIEVKEFFRA
ncbi:MAG TPA: hypothetical protein PLF87_09600 [Syntrophorhabdaceae bacterium]|nr:hypothetical protein [Syntrophorhabdaceae bacterium]